MRDTSSQPHRASAVREVAYPVEHVWSAMASLLPYCSVCDVSVIVDSPGDLEAGTKFRAFSGHAAQTDGMPSAEGGMAGEIVDWAPQQTVATRLEAASETVVVCVEMAPASQDTTLVTISVQVTPRLRSRLAAAMSRSSYARMARRTVEGEIQKLPAHLALLEEREG
ncbi:MAG: SRPBCC family protein [Geodermatophilaceae bacterium]|nr:SRPBCC family protein [Geodermatophilaceae bacterium]